MTCLFPTSCPQPQPLTFNTYYCVSRLQKNASTFKSYQYKVSRCLQALANAQRFHCQARLPNGASKITNRRGRSLRKICETHSTSATRKLTASREPLLPYNLPDQVDAILPSEIFGLPGFSHAQYVQDVFAIFAATPSQNDISEMHKVWFKCRSPTVDELWASRHPAAGFAKTKAGQILRKIATLQELLQQATASQLVQKAQMLLLDHLMLMCTEYNTDYYTLYFPDYEARFYELVEILGVTEPSVPTLGKEDNISTPGSNSSIVIAPEIRTRIEGLRVEPTSVTPLELISGNSEGKRMIEKTIFISTQVAHLASEGLGSPGILLHGPPGTGKTLLAKASAAESVNCKVYSVLSSDLVEKWQGTSEQNIAALFQIAGENAPAAIVIDEVEGLCRSRQSSSGSGADSSMHRIANAFLACMTKYKGVVVIGTTNLPWNLDQAFGRRFRTKVLVGLPSEAARLEIIRRRLSRFNHSLSGTEMKRFAQDCRGFTGDSIVQTINAALEDLTLDFKSATHFRPVRAISSIAVRLLLTGVGEHRGETDVLPLRCRRSRIYETHIRGVPAAGLGRQGHNKGAHSRSA